MKSLIAILSLSFGVLTNANANTEGLPAYQCTLSHNAILGGKLTNIVYANFSVDAGTALQTVKVDVPAVAQGGKRLPGSVSFIVLKDQRVQVMLWVSKDPANSSLASIILQPSESKLTHQLQTSINGDAYDMDLECTR